MDPETAAKLREARRLDAEGQSGRATLAYKLLLRTHPECQEARVDLAGLLMVLGRFQEALDLCLEVLEARPGDRSAWQNLIGALLGLEDYEEADGRCRDLLAADPAFAPAHLGLGMSLANRDRQAEAEAEFLAAVRLDPSDPRARNALLKAQVKQHAWDRAFETWMSITDLDMEGPKASFEKAVVLLTFGRYPEAWELYESRFDPPNDVGPKVDVPQPLWDGAPFPGRNLLLHYEQGFGDTLMLIRYADQVKARGGTVTALVQRSLLPVLASCPHVDRWITPEDPVPPFDLHLPFFSLPRVLGTRLDTIPAPVPYLAAPARPAPALDAAIAPSPRLKAGLVWAGNTAHKHDFLRTLPSAVLQPLRDLPGVDWYSLQLGYEGGLPWEGLRDLAPHLCDFGDTALALDRLDVLVTVDTAVAHLAGAMGRPVLLMVPLMPDWRWLLEGERSPWYPSIRIFRQLRHGEWEDVVTAVAGSLNQLMNSLRGTC